MKLYRFTGSIKNLKSAGWKFHKLYAANYKAYNKENIWLFVKSKMLIEIEGFTVEEQKIVIDFILQNKGKNKDFWLRPPSNKFPLEKYRGPNYILLNNEVIFWKKKFEIAKEIGELIFHEKPLFIELVNLIKELDSLGLDLVEI